MSSRYFATSLLLTRQDREGWTGVSIEYGVEVKDASLEGALAQLVDALGARLVDDVGAGNHGVLRNPSERSWDLYHDTVQNGVRTTAEEARRDGLEQIAIPALFVVDVGESVTWHRIQGQMTGIRARTSSLQGERNRRPEDVAHGVANSEGLNRVTDRLPSRGDPGERQGQ